MSAKNDTPFQLVIHGGAGTIRKSGITPEMEAAIHQALRNALEAGRSILKSGDSALDAVEAAVVSMEDCEHFNAGRGSVFTENEEHEMEAAIMDGSNLECGTVMMIKKLKNPVKAARLVMEQSNHVSLCGTAAEVLAEKFGHEQMPPSYFHTDRRLKSLRKVKSLTDPSKIKEEDRHGTVGAVALDIHGNLAAATSTGGTTNKRSGRIGDTPIIGASTWADNRSCAVSTTGQGEYFMRLATARDIAAMIEYKGLTIEEAICIAIFDKLGPLGGNGGAIGIDHQGNIAMVFNSEGMYSGVGNASGVSSYLYE